MKRLALILLVLLLPISALAVGPKMVAPHTVAWDPNSEPDLAGYYVYWRPTGGAFDDAHRVQCPVSPTPRYDLLLSISQNGSYEIAVTAYDTSNNESGFSNIVPFVVKIPAAPKGTKVQSP